MPFEDVYTYVTTTSIKVQNLNITSECFLVPLSSQSPAPTGSHPSDFSQGGTILLVLALYVNRIIQYVTWYDQLLLLSIPSVRFIQLVPVSEVHSISSLNNTLLLSYTTIWLSINQLLDFYMVTVTTRFGLSYFFNCLFF